MGFISFKLELWLNPPHKKYHSKISRIVQIGACIRLHEPSHISLLPPAPQTDPVRSGCRSTHRLGNNIVSLQ